MIVGTLSDLIEIERPLSPAVSTDRRNTLAKSFGWCFVV